MRTLADAALSIPTLLTRAGLVDVTRAPDWSQREIVGHSNIVFDVCTGADRFAVRIQRTARDRVARASEVVAMGHAWRLGLGAEPLWNDDLAGVQITRWIETARPLSHADFNRNPGLFAEAARTLGRFHKGAGALPHRLDPLQRLQAFGLDSAGRGSWMVGPDLHENLKCAALRLAAQQEQVPSHCDASPGNFLATDTGLRLIDWEYAAMAPTAWDSGYLAVEAGLEPEAALMLLKAGDGVKDLAPRDILDAMLLAGLQNALWVEEHGQGEPQELRQDLDRRRAAIARIAIFGAGLDHSS